MTTKVQLGVINIRRDLQAFGSRIQSSDNIVAEEEEKIHQNISSMDAFEEGRKGKVGHGCGKEQDWVLLLLLLLLLLDIL